MSGPGKILQHIAMDSSGQSPHSLRQRSLPTGSGAKFWTLRPPVVKRGWKILHVRWFFQRRQSPIKLRGCSGISQPLWWLEVSWIGFSAIFLGVLTVVPAKSPISVATGRFTKVQFCQCFQLWDFLAFRRWDPQHSDPKRWCPQWKWCFFVVTPLVRSTTVAS